ncbi:adenosine receptor A2a-like [Oratosquilla oratoria]|uniref:adenosine receptor A2a-like n=1 Tax=Oratosquilla oratoria TaxID=337810 RepID=UPI003F75A71C
MSLLSTNDSSNSGSGNLTCDDNLLQKENDPTGETVSVAWTMALALVVWCSSGVTMNAIWRCQRLHSFQNALILNLAAGDILLGFVVFNVAITRAYNLVMGLPFDRMALGMCMVSIILMCMSRASIISSLLAIALDRFLAIREPLRYYQILTAPIRRAVVAAIWSVSLTEMLVLLLPWSRGPSWTHWKNECLFGPVFGRPVAVTINLVHFAGSSAVLAIYVALFKIARKHRLQIQQERQLFGEYHTNTFKENVKAAKFTLRICIVFLVCWWPQNILRFLEEAFGYVIHGTTLQKFLELLLVINSALNMFLYAWFNKDFREAYLQMIRRKRQNRVNIVPPTDMLPAPRQ